MKTMYYSLNNVELYWLMYGDGMKIDPFIYQILTRNCTHGSTGNQTFPPIWRRFGKMYIFLTFVKIYFSGNFTKIGRWKEMWPNYLSKIRFEKRSFIYHQMGWYGTQSICQNTDFLFECSFELCHSHWDVTTFGPTHRALNLASLGSPDYTPH